MPEKPECKREISTNSLEITEPKLLRFLDSLFDDDENDDFEEIPDEVDQELEEGDELYLIGKKLLKESGVYPENW